MTTSEYIDWLEREKRRLETRLAAAPADGRLERALRMLRKANDTGALIPLLEAKDEILAALDARPSESAAGEAKTEYPNRGYQPEGVSGREREETPPSQESSRAPDAPHADDSPARVTALPGEPQSPGTSPAPDSRAERYKRWFARQRGALDYMHERDRLQGELAAIAVALGMMHEQSMGPSWPASGVELAQRVGKLQGELEEARRDCERMRDERAAVLNVKTTDGLTASEWIARTGVAERDLARARGEVDALREKMAEENRREFER